ncbi:hypothetical protein N7535_005627 [Penicillium sp. DV-2018c]|nr:hypothetical protein N7461_009201 [Penicillium sp. DV-2018c]KAJ5571967.1 hypothetical protein N7535_005627 [Penicillium sp. DV-2018c]
MDDPVRASIKEVDGNTWLIGPLQLRRSKGYRETSTWYDQDDDLSYTLTDAPVPRPVTVPLPANDPTIKLVYDAGDSSAVWSVGKSAFCKVKLSVAGTTSEAATLDFVHGLRPDFDIPKVFHQTEDNDRSYLFLSRVPGRTLADAWPTLDGKWRDHYMNAVVRICEFLASREGDTLCGVDGKNVLEPWLIKYGLEKDYSPYNLQQGCEALGNIIVEDIPTVGSVGIIDWEVAGFFPRGWVRTKFRISGGLNLPDSATDIPQEWRSGVQKLLGAQGFEDYTSQFVSWWD